MNCVIESNEIQEVKKTCSMCKQLFPARELKNNKCPECQRIMKEWQNGREKTPEEKIKFKKIRVHYTIPAYKRIYSVYQYDQLKYNEIFKKVQKLAFKYGKKIFDNVNSYDVLKQCYVLDNGVKQHLGDEKHIYRYGTLEKVLSELAQTLLHKHKLQNTPDVMQYLFKRTNIAFYDNDTPQAEFMPTFRLPINWRLKVNILLLKLLKEDGLEIEEATDLLKWQFNFKNEIFV